MPPKCTCYGSNKVRIYWDSINNLGKGNSLFVYWFLPTSCIAKSERRILMGNDINKVLPGLYIGGILGKKALGYCGWG